MIQRWWVAGVFLCALAAGAAPEFAVTGRVVRVTTDRYVAEVDGLRLTRLANRLTGETYAAPAAGADAATVAKAGRAGVAIESLRPAAPTRLFALAERTTVAAERLPDGVTLSYGGLQCGDEFDPRLTLALTVRVDAATGDLLLQPAVRAEIEEVHGVRDRGVLHAALECGAFSDDLRLIIPASDGFSVTRDTVAADFTYHARWPQTWEAALLIAESAKGCVGLWADEPALRYGRTLGIARSAGWHVGLAFETADEIQRCTAIQGATWRLNVFAGYWVQAAARYRAQMQQQWPDLKPLKGGAPAWADRVRIVITGPTPSIEQAKLFAAMVPRDTLAVFTCQEWLKGWNEGDIAKLNKGMDYFPNFPFDNPSHYEAREDMPAKFTALEAMGIHLFPYTNPTIVTHGHPWLQRKIGPRAFLGYKLWQRFYPELCADLVKRYGVSGIYEDCSWVISRSLLGESGGDNWYNGSAHMRQYFRELLPTVAVMGERNNEVTWRGQKFALSITQWGGHAHPIVTYLCSPFLRMWNLQLQPGGFDADDIRGWMTPWPYSVEKNPIQERRMLRQRGLVFAHEQLESVWPDQWDPAVLHYFKSAGGVAYRFLRDRGTRFVKLGADGATETLYWRLNGVRDAAVAGLGIEGWVGYDGEAVVGLNPRAVYPLFDGIARPPVTIAAVPEGSHLARTVIREGFWLVQLGVPPPGKDAAGKPLPPAPPVTGTVRVRARDGVKLLGFCGAKASREVRPGEYEVTLAVPGGLGAYWAAPEALGEGSHLTDLPASNSIHRRDSGLVSYYGAPLGRGNAISQQVGTPEAGEEGTVAWLVKLPDLPIQADQTFLHFAYGSGHPYGDGANYSVRINGKTVWKRYRAEQGKRDPAKGEQPVPVPLQAGQVKLKPWAGQIAVLELVADGNKSSVSEAIRWGDPQITDQPDHQAETDDQEAAPEPDVNLKLQD